MVFNHKKGGCCWPACCCFSAGRSAGLDKTHDKVKRRSSLAGLEVIFVFVSLLFLSLSLSRSLSSFFYLVDCFSPPNLERPDSFSVQQRTERYERRQKKKRKRHVAYSEIEHVLSLSHNNRKKSLLLVWVREKKKKTNDLCPVSLLQTLFGILHSFDWMMLWYLLVVDQVSKNEKEDAMQNGEKETFPCLSFLTFYELWTRKPAECGLHFLPPIWKKKNKKKEERVPLITWSPS